MELIDNEEHINATESHRAIHCPGSAHCAVQAGLVRLLAGLNDGTLVIREVTSW